MLDHKKEFLIERARIWRHARFYAENDLKCHQEFGISLNPFSTAGARYEWQKGFEATEQDPTKAFNAYWQRGFAAGRLVGQ